MLKAEQGSIISAYIYNDLWVKIFGNRRGGAVYGGI